MYGGLGFLCIYYFSGIAANICTYVLNKSPLSVGASGSVFGIMGSIAAFYYMNKKYLGYQAEAGLDNVKRTLLINLFYGMSVPGNLQILNLFLY